jgi:CIC family chloride channel protein
MLGCVMAIVMAGRLEKDSIYTEPLRAKGVADGEDTTRFGAATAQTVGDVMLEPVPPVRENAPLHEIADLFIRNSNNFLPVVDADNRLLGIVALHDLKEHLGAGAELGAVIAYDVMRPPPRCATPNQRLVDVFHLALASEQQNIPVVSTLTEQRLVGRLSRAQVLGLFAETIAAGSKPGL